MHTEIPVHLWFVIGMKWRAKYENQRIWTFSMKENSRQGWFGYYYGIFKDYTV